MQIMIVEDEAVVALDLRQVLEQAGHQVVAHAARGDIAVSLAQRRRPDIVLMDVRLAGEVDGIDAAKRIRSQLGLPVVFLTAHSDRDTLERLRPHASAVLTKPFDEAELPAALQVALDRHLALAQERHRREEMTVTLATMYEGVATTDAGGNVVYLNPAAERMTGWTSHEASGRPIEDVVPIVHGDVLRHPHPARQALAQRDPVLLADGFSLRRRSGEVMPVGDSATAMRDGDRLLGSVMVVQDQTELKEQRDRALRQARLASLGRVVATVAHELSSPLTLATLNTELLSRRLAPDDPEAHELLDEVQTAIDSMHRVVQTMRRLGRRPSPAIKEAALIHDHLVSAVQMARATSAVRVEVDIEPDLWVRAHVGEVGQVVRNLVENAVDASEEGGAVRVSARAEPPWAVITVADEGCGMTQDVLERLYEPFFTTKSPETGTGLGLAVAHRIVEDHEGSIEVRSALHQGTTFVVRLPLGQHRGAQRPSVTQTCLRILLVDDHDLLRRGLQRGLPAHDVVPADSVAAAVQVLEHDTAFDAVITDVRMPIQPGVELLRVIRERFPTLVPRFGFMTGGIVEDAVVAEARSSGRPTLFKPFSMSELEAFALRLAGHAQSEQASG